MTVRIARARIRIALVDAHGFIWQAARSLGIDRHWLHRYVKRMGLHPLIVEWRKGAACPSRGRPRKEDTPRREQWRRSKAKARRARNQEAKGY